MKKVDIDMEMVKELLVLSDNSGDKRITLEHITRTTAQFLQNHLNGYKIKNKNETDNQR